MIAAGCDAAGSIFVTPAFSFFLNTIEFKLRAILPCEFFNTVDFPLLRHGPVGIPVSPSKRELTISG